jgi:uncharacterized protein YaiL (DUF2058 family)
MSESLRDQLLKSGLARKFKAEQAKPAKPPHRPAPPKREQSEIDLAKAYAMRDSTERAERDRAQREAEERAREKKERRQRLTQLLNGKAQNAEDADIARHFPHANKIRRVYVTAAQLPRINGGELGVVQLTGRYLIVDVETAKAVRELDPESLVLLCDPMENATEDDVPSDLVW